MSILSIQNLSLEFSERVLFKSMSFEIEEKDKVGFVGANGVGKTTFFKILTGEIEPTSGMIAVSKNIKIGYMEQHACINSEKTIFEELLSVYENLIKMEDRLKTLTELIENDLDNRDEYIREQFDLTEKFQNNDGLTYKSRTRAALIGLGFDESMFTRSVSTLSGGQKSKLSLAKLLLSNPDILLLDEPTNHLDISSVQWLEEFIKAFKGTAIIISHDRYFLDSITNKTIELEHEKIMLFKGNYSVFLEKKKAYNEQINKEYNNQIKEINRIKAIVEQQRRWGQEHNFITAESKLKQIKRLESELVLPEKELDYIKFDFKINRVSGNDVLFCDNISKTFDNKKVLENISFNIKKGSRVFILGENGIGKTTLFKIIAKKLMADSGNITYGANVDIGYFEQMQDSLSLDKTPFSEIHDTFPYLNSTEVRSALARFMFKADDVFKENEKLSGGERARIALLKLMLRGDNFLLLDEPTNHLDTKSREILEKTLLSFDGTLLIVSHDRYFINKLADRILYLSSDGVTEYNGNYDYFLEKRNDINESVSISSQPIPKKMNDYKLKKILQSDIRKLKTKIINLEKEIEANDKSLEDLQNKLSSEEVISDYQKIVDITAEIETLDKNQTQLLQDWEESIALLDSYNEKI